MPVSAPATAEFRVKNPSEPVHFRFRDFAGNIVSDTDECFRGKVVIVAIGGSWCPNCHDEAPFLETLYEQYQARGLEVVGLFFEEADQLQDPSRVRAFVKQYGIRYPMLLAGETGELHEKLPQAVNLDCWPTAFFLDRSGLVRAVHAGYAAPASGVYHEELEKDVNQLLEACWEKILWQRVSLLVARTLVSAASRFVPTLFFTRGEDARHECRAGRQECLRHV